MASQARPREETRPALSRERVLEAAIALADEAGIGSLTMRKLAQELGVEAMTLYYYVAKKDDILNGIVDIVIGEIELPSPGDDWKPALRRMAISAYEVLVRHPWAAGLVLSSSGVSASRLRYMESILGTPADGRLLGRDDRSRLSRAGEPHHGVHAVGGRHGPRQPRGPRANGERHFSVRSIARSCPTSPSTWTSTSSRVSPTRRATLPSGSTCSSTASSGSGRAAEPYPSPF